MPRQIRNRTPHPGRAWVSWALLAHRFFLLTHLRFSWAARFFFQVRTCWLCMATSGWWCGCRVHFQTAPTCCQKERPAVGFHARQAIRQVRRSGLRRGATDVGRGRERVGARKMRRIKVMG